MHGNWRVSFAGTGQLLKELTFATSEKVEQLAERGGALRCLADKQALETGIRAGLGGVHLHLSAEQVAKLRQNWGSGQ